MLPLIVVSCSSSAEDYVLRRNYCKCIAQAGGLPLILPYAEGNEAISDIALRADALLLSGGGDVAPVFYGENQRALCGQPDWPRDTFELTISKQFLRLKKPILGICRGMQLLNVLCGGTLYQDISEMPTVIKHNQQQPKTQPSHSVYLQNEFATLLGTQIEVNSFHHQGIKKLGAGLLCGANSEDGLIEGFYSKDKNLWGVQWHPEHLSDISSKKLFTAFVLATGDK